MAEESVEWKPASPVAVDEIRFHNGPGMWGKGLIVGDDGRAEVEAQQVAIAGVRGFAGGRSTPHATSHEIVAVAGSGGEARSGDSGIAVCAGGATSGVLSGKASVESRGLAYAKTSNAVASGHGSVAMSFNGYSKANAGSIAVAWMQPSAHPEVAGWAEAGARGLAIGHHGTRVKAGKGGALIAMFDSRDDIPTLIWPVEKDGVKADQWYQIVLENGAFHLVEAGPKESGG